VDPRRSRREGVIHGFDFELLQRLTRVGSYRTIRTATATPASGSWAHGDLRRRERSRLLCNGRRGRHGVPGPRRWRCLRRSTRQLDSASRFEAPVIQAAELLQTSCAHLRITYRYRTRLERGRAALPWVCLQRELVCADTLEADRRILAGPYRSSHLVAGLLEEALPVILPAPVVIVTCQVPDTSAARMAAEEHTATTAMDSTIRLVIRCSSSASPRRGPVASLAARGETLNQGSTRSITRTAWAAPQPTDRRITVSRSRTSIGSNPRASYMDRGPRKWPASLPSGSL
jgi:hypothetical protein